MEKLKGCLIDILAPLLGLALIVGCIVTMMAGITILIALLSHVIK